MSGKKAEFGPRRLKTVVPAHPEGEIITHSVVGCTAVVGNRFKINHCGDMVIMRHAGGATIHRTHSEGKAGMRTLSKKGATPFQADHFFPMRSSTFAAGPSSAP